MLQSSHHLVDGHGTDNDQLVPNLGATFHVDDAVRALFAALKVNGAVDRVCRNRERGSNRRIVDATAGSGHAWRPGQ